MSVYKEEKTNTWRVIYRYTDWTGQRKQSQKRGFKTKREAQAWEREQMSKVTADLDMTFESFIKLYTQDMQSRIKENTWHTKENIINTKLLPYFKKRKISQITPKDIINWQNEMINHRDAKGKPYSPVYLKTLHNQLSAIFNHAVKYYGLRENPAAKVGNMGKSKSREMLFWTKEEYLKFAEVMMDKPVAYYAVEVLYWCGIREGELLALTPADFDFTIPSENHPISPAQEPSKNLKFRRIYMKTGLSKKQKVTEVFYNAKDPTAEIYTHDSKLKKRLSAFSKEYPELCQQTDDDGQGGLWFEIAKERISIRLTAPYSQQRREAASKLAKENNTFRDLH